MQYMRWVLVAAVALAGSSSTAAPIAFVANFVDDSVSIIDTETGVVVDTITGVSEATAIAQSPDGTTLYAQGVFGTLSIIERVVGDVTTLFTGGRGIVMSPDGSRAYIRTTSSVVILDTATNTLVGSPIGVGSSPSSEALLPDGSRLYVANLFSNSVSVIDLVTEMVVATIPLSFMPTMVVAHPDGSRVYVGGFSDDLHVVNTVTNTFLPTITGVVTLPSDAVSHPDGSTLYVSGEGIAEGEVVVIDLGSGTITTRVLLGALGAGSGIGILPDGSTVYVAIDNDNTGINDNTVGVIATATNTLVDTIPVGDAPRDIELRRVPLIFLDGFESGDLSAWGVAP